jgi:hypothetical protein
MKPRAGVSRKSHVKHKVSETRLLRAAQAIPRDRTTGRQSRDAKSCNSSRRLQTLLLLLLLRLAYLRRHVAHPLKAQKLVLAA